MKSRSFQSWVPAAALLLTSLAQAQWTTQTFDLRGGWNATYLNVDPSHATISQLLASDPGASIEEIWMWQVPSSLGQFVSSPQQPVSGTSQWRTWRRTDVAGSSLQGLLPNAAYLVRVRSDLSSFTWQVKGKAVAPSHRWTGSGLNFVGFPTLPATPPTFEDFLAQSPAEFQQTAEIFRYPGGNLGVGNPARVFALRTTRVRRGEAFWMRSAEHYNSYFGPFDLTVSGPGAVDLGDASSVFSMRLRNLAPVPVVVTLNLVASEAPPVGQPAISGAPPLLVRGERNTTNLTYAYAGLPVGTPRTWTLASAGQLGSETEVVLGLDRSVLTGASGALHAGVLRFTDSLNLTRVDVGVSARVGSSAGLWVGSAGVSQVGQYLKTYSRDRDNQPRINPDGSYEVVGTNTNLGSVPGAYPLRLIVHNPATGPAVLLQQVFTGENSASNIIVATREASLDRRALTQSRRISAAHLPWTAANAGWNFTGPLRLGSNVTASVTNRFNNHASNPFLHTYHPDHDSLDPRFQREVPQGSESYTVVRDISLEVTPPTDDFVSRTTSAQALSGTYRETIRLLGLARAGNTVDTRTFEVLGSFQLNRISAVPTVTRP
jgi:hypothetical protein